MLTSQSNKQEKTHQKHKTNKTKKITLGKKNTQKTWTKPKHAGPTTVHL